MKRTRKKARRLFNPDVVVTTAHQFLERDLRSSTRLYGRVEHPGSMYATRQVADFQKKYASPYIQQNDLEELTYDKFHTVNEHMSAYRDFDFPDTSTRVTSRISARERVFLRARALMHFVLTDFELDEFYSNTRHGIGSSIGVPFRDTSIERKFTFPMTCTSRVKPLLLDYLSYDSSLREAVEEYNSCTPSESGIQVVKGSRATTVEKNNDIRRMIAIEPTGNMFFQQSLMAMMYKRMKAVGLDLESLPAHHQDLAFESSITQKNATIDFSSASDCVSIGLLRWLLPAKWFRYCDMVRSPSMFINEQEVELNMFSTMGNAVTFPLETLVFWTIAISTDETNYIGNSLFPEWENLKSASVFGDDCIVPTYNAKCFISFCKSVGFIVNDDKSFYEDEQFRESCGGDYHVGYNVRPYCVRAPSSLNLSALEPWLYTMANAVLKKYISYFGQLSYVYDKDFFTYLFTLFRQYNLLVKVVPDDFPDDAGLKISSDLQRFAACYEIPFSPIHRSHHGTYSFNYCRFIYRHRLEVDDNIRYYSELKKLHSKDRPRPLYRNIRRKGGYVVAKALTCHWHVPPVKLGVAR